MTYFTPAYARRLVAIAKRRRAHITGFLLGLVLLPGGLAVVYVLGGGR